jgi:hypothetical protein
MKKSRPISLLICLILFLLFGVQTYSQEVISWLSDYTSDFNTGSYTYKYGFFTVEGKDCKMKIEEQKTDKKANTVKKSYVFYLSDLDPLKITYKPSGTTIVVTLTTKASQKFVSVFSDAGLEEYTNALTIYLDAVDKARSFIDAMKKHCDECKSSEKSWTSPTEAFTWLNKNIIESLNSGSSVKQTFTQGDKGYLAVLTTETTDSKGISNKTESIFDLSDINPGGIMLEISGKSLKVILPVKDDKYFIQEESNEMNFSYAKETKILSDDIETARGIINALNYLSSSAKPVRKVWGNYSEALNYLKTNLKETIAGSNKITQAFNYNESNSGSVTYKTIETDAKGLQIEEINSFYLADINPAVKLEVTSKAATLKVETKNKEKYIKQTIKDKTNGHTSSVKIMVDDLDKARDLIVALEYAISKSSEGVQEFSNVQKATDWLNKNPGDVYIDSKSFHQSIQFDPSNENKIDLNVITSDAAGASVNERFELYPEDIAADQLKIEVSGKKLFVPISTGKFKYIKAYKGDVLQNYTGEIEYLFEDIQIAKNFIAALKCLQQKSTIADRAFNDKGDAYAFLVENIKDITVESKKVEQKIEQVESSVCKMKYTLTETDSKGASIENMYEFFLSDIDLSKSEITVSSKELKINLLTREKQKLVKLSKNGEPGNFIYNVEILTDDVLVGKKILGAFKTLSEDCK